MPDEMIPQEPTLLGFNKKSLIGLLVVAALILAGFIAWLIFKPSPSPPAIPAGPGISGLPAAEEISWQKYTNEKYVYSFKYPQAWYLDSTNADKDFNQGIGGELILSNKENPLALLQSNSAPADLITMTLSIFSVSSQTTLDQFIKDQKYSTPLSQALVLRAGLSGKQLIYILPKDKTEVLNIVTILKQNTRMFVFSWYSFTDKLKLPPEVETIHDEILKSFEVK